MTIIVKPESVGLDTDRLLEVDKVMDKYIQDQDISGAITLVARRGQIAHLKCQGLMDFENKLAMQQDAIFRIYSMTKPITTVAIMMLYEQGHFRLDTPVHTFIPEFRNLRVFKSGTAQEYETGKPKRPMTMKDLLTHQSGLSYHFVNAHPVGEIYREMEIPKIIANGTIQEFIQKLSEAPLVFSPGERWNYGFSSDVLGYIVELISGKTLQEFMQDNIFSPLGMKDTKFWVDEENLDRLCPLYTHKRFLSSSENNPLSAMIPIKRDEVAKDATLLRMDTFIGDSDITKPPSIQGGGGGLFSTIIDYYKFADMLRNKGKANGNRLLSPRTIELMTANHLDGDMASNAAPGFTELAQKGAGFGLGFASSLGPVASGSLDSFGQFSWGGAANTFFYVDPKEDMVAILMTQLFPSSTYPIRQQFSVAIHQAILD